MPQFPSLCWRIDCQLRPLPANRPSWPNQHLHWPTFVIFLFPDSMEPGSFRPYSPIIPEKCTVTSVQIKVLFNSGWTLFSSAIVYNWLKSVFTAILRRNKGRQNAGSDQAAPSDCWSQSLSSCGTSRCFPKSVKGDSTRWLTWAVEEWNEIRYGMNLASWLEYSKCSISNS